MALGLTVAIKGDPSGLNSALDESKGSTSGFGVNIGSSALKVAAFAGVVGIAANVVSDLTNAAAEDEAGQLKLDQAIRAAGAAQGDYNAVVDEAIAKGQEKAFSDDQTREALQSLVTSTGDLTAANALLGPAQDIARAAGVDLATAADAVAKANEGQATQLSRLLPGLDKGATAADTLANATKAAAGQADTYANSAKGMQDKGADAFSELGETIGSAFLPVIKELVPALIPVIKSFAQIVTALLPVLIPLLTTAAKIVGIVATAIAGLASQLASVIKWLSDAIKWVGDFVSSLNPLKGVGDFIGGIVGGRSSGGGGSSGLSRSRGARGSSSGFSAPLVVNIYGTSDTLATEAAVVRALRRETRLNGGTSPSWDPLG